MRLFSWSWGKKEHVTTNVHTEYHTATNGEQVDIDRSIIEQLRKAGLDLSVAFHIRHIFSAPSRDSAQQLARELTARSYRPEVSQEGSLWKVFVTQDVVLSEGGMKAKRAEFSALAGNFSGRYQGWDMNAKQTKTINFS